jgi:LysM repeat protein
MMRKLMIVLLVVSLFAALTGGASAQDVPAPAITITSPAWGAVVTNEGTITVTGIATNLFEGGLVVQALDAAGTVLAEQAVTAPGAALGGTGTWSAELTVSAEANTAGKIYAFATSAQDGSLAAQASIDVTFGAPPPVSAIAITTPAAGSVLNTAGGVVVMGTASNIPDAQFTLEARNANGTVLAQTGVTASSTGSDATWQSTLNPLIVANTAGSIVAYDVAADGTVAQAVVSVTFLANCAPRTDWPTYQVQVGDNLFRIAQRVGSTVDELTRANCLVNPSVVVVGQNLYVPRLPQPTTPGGDGGMVEQASIAITSPEQGANLALGSPITVTGTGALLFDGNVIVRVLDDQDQVISEDTTTLEDVQFDGTGKWEIDIPVTAAQGTRGTILAYSGGGDDIIQVSDAVNVVFGASPPAETFVTIASPIPYANTGGTTFTVSGRAARLSEGGLVVEARDYSGRLLGERSVQVTTGEWSTQLAVNVAVGTHGVIKAFAVSETGMPVGDASTSVSVVFGLGSAAQPFVSIAYPLPGDALSAGVGTQAGGVPQGMTLAFEVLDENGTVLDWVPAKFEDNDLWVATLGIDPSTLSGTGSLAVYFADAATGRVLAYDRVPVVFGQ